MSYIRHGMVLAGAVAAALASLSNHKVVARTEIDMPDMPRMDPREGRRPKDWQQRVKPKHRKQKRRRR